MARSARTRLRGAPPFNHALAARVSYGWQGKTAQPKPVSNRKKLGDIMSAVRVRRVALYLLIFVAVIVAVSAVGIWFELGAVVE